MSYSIPHPNRFERWLAGKELSLGREISSRLSRQQSVAWAAAILRHSSQLKTFPEVERLLQVALTEQAWSEADALHSQIRRRWSLESEGIGKCVLRIADRVAKIVYNASSPDVTYDSNSLDYLPSDVLSLVVQRNDDDFARATWAVLTTSI